MDGPVRVPYEVGKGNARITLRYRDGKAPPALFESPIIEPKPKEPEKTPKAEHEPLDLTKIVRTIAKEPAYKSKPKYCLLVFGPEAKSRVWLVLDGDALYVDRNGNGDLTEKGERNAGVKYPDIIRWQIGDIVETGAMVRHVDLRVWISRGSYFLQLRTSEGVLQEVGNEFGLLRFSDRAKDAPIVHLAGPLTFFLSEGDKRDLRLVPGQKSHFIALIGTVGLGEGTTAYCHAAEFGKLKMVGEVAFPRQAPAAPLRVSCTQDFY